jgi:hypothetical protein
VRNAERGTNRDLGIPGEWTSEAKALKGTKTPGEFAACACVCGSRLRSYSEEEAEAHERRARCFAHRASLQPGIPQEPGKAEGGGPKPNEVLPTVTLNL